ncbi:TetR-type transcriptional regulator [Bifidobacterium margollesii]|uniref:TetR-type transcriptional regulator n=1 Tax=Bifidobacterium margollesii TaxID=2020964 RepID=A0A2N5J869_9BIFI|nr:TetR family transcriptional regulator [Bifidobacterium margollesii]PLS30406.1 TetR-type transcriptional regulator [Bifidobacterium margollesii]
MAISKSMFRPINRRRRLSPEARRAQIAEAAADLIARYGSYGFSMQTLADAVGLTVPGLAHYIKTREELLTLVIARYYDASGIVPEYVIAERAGAAGSANDGDSGSKGGVAEGGGAEPATSHDSTDVHSTVEGLLNYPASMRRLVESNAKRPQMVNLFMRLAIEAADPTHPAHELYAHRHRKVLDDMMAKPWNLPPQYRDPEAKHDLFVTVFFAMDGVQEQALTNPDESMLDLWAHAERILFPSPTWDGYR